MLAVVLAAGAIAVTWFSADPSMESGRAVVTTPEVEETPTTAPAVAPVPEPPIPDPLDRRVRGFDGTLVIALGTGDGLEVRRWSSGPDGVLERSVPEDDLYDASFDASGRLVAAIRRYGREPPSLRVGSHGELSPIFWGAHSYAWHSHRPEALAWVSQGPREEQPMIHIGRSIDDGVYFKPAGTVPGFDFRDGLVRLVAYDDWGFVFETWGTRREITTVTRLSPQGTPVATVEGWYIGASPTGRMAIGTEGRTVVLDAATLSPVPSLPSQYSSVAWADDGRMAATHFESTVVDLIDGSGVRSVDIGQIQPTALGWSADDRFVVLAGHAEADPVLVFVDAATLDTTTLFVSGHPIAAVALP